MEINNYLIPLLLRHLQLIDVKCDPKELQLMLLSAPSFPSILSIVQTYAYFGIKTTAYRADYAALTKATTPAVAHITQGNTDRFILINTVSETEVIYYDAFINKEIKTSKDDFCKLWSGIILLSEKTESSTFYRSTNKAVKYGISFAVLCLIFLSFIINSHPQLFLFFYGLLALKSAGIWFTLGLLKQESKGSYSVFDKFCHKHKVFDCAKITQSKASKLFNKIALADLGFVYFTTGFCALCFSLFSGIVVSILLVLFYLSVCSIPFILFSIFYQKIVVRKWCPLCLSTVFILIIEIILYLVFPTKVFIGNLALIVEILLFSFFSSLGILFLTKCIIENQAKVFKISISALRLKRTPLIISTVFKSQKDMSLPISDGLTIGNPKAPITITTFLNPMCNPCKNMVAEMVKLQESYSSFIQWHIRLDGVVTPECDYRNNPQLYLFGHFIQNESTQVRLNIIKKWFKSQSLSKFSESYPLNNISEEVLFAFSEHLRNNNKLKAEKVPSIWINNRLFPEEYSLQDIPFLLTDLDVLLKSTI